MPLKSLNLDHTEMTEAGARSLLLALQHPDCKIADLSIEGNRFSKPLKRMIKKAVEPGHPEKMFRSLPKYDQTQFYGRERRPSFNVLKSKVTVDAIHRLLTQRLQKKM